LLFTQRAFVRIGPDSIGGEFVQIKSKNTGPPKVGRRELLSGAGAAAVAGAAGVLGTPGSAQAANYRHRHHHHVKPIPSPIDAVIPSGIPGLPPGSPLENIHWLLPGPVGSATPVIGLPGFGLDVDPSTVGDYKGFTAYAVVAGEAKGSDGNTYACEFDVRVMDGIYKAEDGSIHRGTYGFF
jgi:hypothetical protein